MVKRVGTENCKDKMREKTNFVKPSMCPICRSSDGDLFSIEHFNVWDLYGCNNCDAQWWEPLKHPGREFYEDAYDMVGSSGDNAIGWGNTQFIKNPPTHRGKLLDVGCCSGDFINVMRGKGFDVWGIDISRRTIDLARALYGLEHVYPETIEEFNTHGDTPKFDVVTFFEVIEHLDRPYEFIGEVKKVLESGGYLAFSTPDRECLRFGWHDSPPQHLFKWNERVLRYMLERQGFEVVTLIREPISAKYFSYLFFGSASPLSFGIASKIKSLLRKNRKEDPTKIDSALMSEQHALLKCVEHGAKLKKKVFSVLVAPLVLIGKILGLKWQSIYVVAKLTKS